MFEDWIKEKQTATDHDIEKDFQIPVNTLKKWRLDKDTDSPMHFRLGDKILYPRAAFVEWFLKHTKNKKAQVVMVKPSQKDLIEIRSLVEKNIIKTKVDKIYKLNEYVDAYKYSQSQRAQGKLVIKVS